jgi:hypothetical protein
LELRQWLTLGNPHPELIIGGAEPKWSKIFFPPITMKLTRIVSIVCLSTVLNFQMKKLTGRSSFSAQRVEKFSI